MPGSPICELKVTLDEVQPPVWRTFRLPAEASLFELHCVLQVVMGWSNSHLHEFVQGKKRYMQPDPEGMTDDLDALDEEDFTVADLLRRPKQKLTYGYDFGDGWEHTVTLVAIHHDGEELACIAGAGACPPDDCGGPGGYTRILDILSNRKHPDYKDTVEWLGDLANDYRDPSACPLDRINGELACGLEDVVANFMYDEMDGFDEDDEMDDDDDEDAELDEGNEEPSPDEKIIVFPSGRPKR